DVDVRQRDGDARLVDEHLHELGGAVEAGEDALERHRLLDAGRALVDGPEHLGHSALRQALDQEVFTEGDRFHGAVMLSRRTASNLPLVHARDTRVSWVFRHQTLRGDTGMTRFVNVVMVTTVLTSLAGCDAPLDTTQKLESYSSFGEIV